MATETTRERAERLHGDWCEYRTHTEGRCEQEILYLEAELEAFRAAVLEEAAKVAEGADNTQIYARVGAISENAKEYIAERIRALKEAKNG